MIYKLHLDHSFPLELRRYRTSGGAIPVSEWLASLDTAINVRVQAYIDRMKAGNFGNSRQVGDGVMELKVNFGAGYRVYYIQDGKSVVVLLCGGDKGSQKTDIDQAKSYAQDYWRRR